MHKIFNAIVSRTLLHFSILYQTTPLDIDIIVAAQDMKWIQFIDTKINMTTSMSSILQQYTLSIHSLNWESNMVEIQTLPEMHISNKFAPTYSNKRVGIHIHTHTHTHKHTHTHTHTNTHTHTQKGSHLWLLVQITSKHRKLKRLPFKYHSHHGESTLTIQKHFTLKISPPDINSNSSNRHKKQFYYYV